MAQPGFIVVPTRVIDRRVSISERVQVANELSHSCVANPVDQAVLVSLHVNAAENEAARGHAVFCTPNEKSILLGQKIHRAMCGYLPGLEVYCPPGYPEGVLPDTFRFEGGLDVLRGSTSIPASVLVEFLFISNKDDRGLLSHPTILEQCAEGILNGIRNYFKDD